MNLIQIHKKNIIHNTYVCILLSSLIVKKKKTKSKFKYLFHIEYKTKCNHYLTKHLDEKNKICCVSK